MKTGVVSAEDILFIRNDDGEMLAMKSLEWDGQALRETTGCMDLGEF